MAEGSLKMGGQRSVRECDSEAVLTDEQELAMQGQKGQRTEERAVSWGPSESHAARTS